MNKQAIIHYSLASSGMKLGDCYFLLLLLLVDETVSSMRRRRRRRRRRREGGAGGRLAGAKFSNICSQSINQLTGGGTAETTTKTNKRTAPRVTATEWRQFEPVAPPAPPAALRNHRLLSQRSINSNLFSNRKAMIRFLHPEIFRHY